MVGFKQRAAEAYDHTILKFEGRAHSDCDPECPQIDVWQYNYLPPEGKLITSKSPIATQKKYWKVPFEARIIAVTLFGNNERYLNGLLDFIESMTYLRKLNEQDLDWGFETFTMRVYVAKRKPSLEHLGPMKNATNDAFIEKLLSLGCEIVYVDNHKAKVGRDATFWRFLTAGEEMPEGQRLRVLLS